MGFPALDRQPNFPALEHRVLARWAERDVFRRTLDSDPDAELFSFYEGPPTANGRPGTHHVEARVFKDIFPRYRTMKGYRVPREAGWDCHGIPVEVEVEKELGFTRKQDIEEFGVAEFNARCRESVQRYVGEFERLTERIGFWVDTDNAYWTMNASYVESVWWSLKTLWDSDLVYEGHRVVPYCPRCGTTLSDHEVAQGYADAVDPSVYVRFPVTEGALAHAGASLLVWTTTPWTLISNTAAVIGPEIDYVLARAAGDDYPVVLAADLVKEVLGDGATVLRDVSHDELLGLHYRGPFDYVGPGSADGTPAADWRYVVSADYVTTTDGTGIVHSAPAFGQEDMATGRAHGLPVVNPVDAEGKFVSDVTDFAGVFVKDADEVIVNHLRRRGLLFKADTYRHTYPFCWRCGTPLLYYAKPSWYIATTRMRDELLAENAAVDWHPEHIREGRYGDWLENNVDWNLSRERYWGTPLPLWRCEDCDDVTAIGSLAELSEKAGRDLSELDPHRPFVDEITIACDACDGTKRRVKEVIDAWYDSGSMPFAQFGYPHAPGSEEAFRARFPADFICEAIDQTRGWFYTLMAVNTLLFGQNSYRSVVVLGLIVDDHGRKMSKSTGNIVDPWSLIDAHGADALRWQMLTDGSPWGNRRVGDATVSEVVRKFLLTLWNTAVFFSTYAAVDGWTPAASAAPAVPDRDVMDRWILAELADTVEVVDGALDRYDTTTAGRRLTRFTDDLSNWYVRRTRRRFWSPDAADAPDKDAAFSTLHECLVTLVALLAPFTPFVADELYEHLVRSVDPEAPESVHLLRFPEANPAHHDPQLRRAMAGARQAATLGLAARNEAGIGVRQPLGRALVTMPRAGGADGQGERDGWERVAGVVADELNVKALEVPESSAETVALRLKPNFRALGPTFGKQTPQVARAIESADATAVAADLRQRGDAEVTVDSATVTVTSDQVQVLEEPRTGWVVASDAGWSVALDITVDETLRREGLAREWIRALNDLRKAHDLDLDQRIHLRVAATGDLAAALHAHRAAIAEDVLAVAVEDSDTGEDEVEVAGNKARVTLEPVSV